MPDLNIGNTEITDMRTAVADYEVQTEVTDGATGQKEFEWQMTLWNVWLGYYKNIPELRIAIDASAAWTVGKGLTTDPTTQFILDGIKGFGKDTFNTIIENMLRVEDIAGDAFAEIIRDKDLNLINLKPLDPSTVKIVTNDKGIIKRYEQTAKTPGNSDGDGIIKFKTDQIFHLSRNRTADEVHGISVIPAVENIILSRNEAMADMKILMHRHVKPRIIFKIDTDKKERIDTFKTQVDNAYAKTENIIIGSDVMEHDILAIPTNATLNPLPWINNLNQYFFQVVGVPQVIIGGAQEFTEATAKIVYLAFQQKIEERQLYIEEQIGMQLGLVIEFEFPASLENELISDKAKGETMQASTPEDTRVQGVGLNGNQ